MNLTDIPINQTPTRFELRKQIILQDKKCERLRADILEKERIYFKLLILTKELEASKVAHEKLERKVKMVERHAMREMNNEP